ncbi:hypothetical protein ACVDG5_000200 [Mesorhizobium sp. ORM6]
MADHGTIFPQASRCWKPGRRLALPADLTRDARLGLLGGGSRRLGADAACVGPHDRPYLRSADHSRLREATGQGSRNAACVTGLLLPVIAAAAFSLFHINAVAQSQPAQPPAAPKPPASKADQMGFKPIDKGGSPKKVKDIGDPQAGSPYAIAVNAGWRLSTGLLCPKPPYGHIRTIVIAPGGDRFMETKIGDEIIAYALPSG